MSSECYEYAKQCSKRKGIWKFIAAILFIAFLGMTATAFLLKVKNNNYRDILIKESREIPNTPEQEEELAEIRKREWGRAHSMANRKSTEEILEENRITEEA